LPPRNEELVASQARTSAQNIILFHLDHCQSQTLSHFAQYVIKVAVKLHVKKKKLQYKIPGTSLKHLTTLSLSIYEAVGSCKKVAKTCLTYFVAASLLFVSLG